MKVFAVLLALACSFCYIKAQSKSKILKKLKKDLQVLKREVSILKDPPYTFVCGYQPDQTIIAQTIPYTKLFYSSTNVKGSGLDINTGVFTAGHPGSYTVTWSTNAHDDENDDQVVIYLRKNKRDIEESRHESFYVARNGGSGRIDEQGGRTIILHLDKGDTLDLYCQDCSARIELTTFCVSLSHADVV